MENKQIGVHTTLDESTLAKVDALAKQECRSRAKQLRILIEKAIGRRAK